MKIVVLKVEQIFLRISKFDYLKNNCSKIWGFVLDNEWFFSKISPAIWALPLYRHIGIFLYNGSRDQKIDSFLYWTYLVSFSFSRLSIRLPRYRDVSVEISSNLSEMLTTPLHSLFWAVGILYNKANNSCSFHTSSLYGVVDISS